MQMVSEKDYWGEFFEESAKYFRHILLLLEESVACPTQTLTTLNKNVQTIWQFISLSKTLDIHTSPLSLSLSLSFFLSLSHELSLSLLIYLSMCACLSVSLFIYIYTYM